MLRTSPYDLICIGNYTRDTIITPSGTKFVDGGAINYSAHAARQLGLSVAVVTRLALEDKRVVEKFASDGIACFVTYTPASTTMQLEYPTHDPDVRRLSVASTAGSISADDVVNIPARAALIGTSLRGEVGLDVIKALKEKGIIVGADAQGFVRVLRGQNLDYTPWDDMEATLSLLDVLKSDSIEAQFLTGDSNIYKAAEKFAQLGAKEIVLTHRDGVLVYFDRQHLQADFHARNLAGRSGRGDTCIGAYMAMRLTLDPYQAAVWAAAVTSLKMEKLGPFDRPLEDVLSLLQEKYGVEQPVVSR